MATVTISITESNLLTLLRTYLLALINGARAIKGQQNRVAMPNGAFVLMTSMGTKELATPEVQYTPGASNPGLQSIKRRMEWKVQLDVYGGKASDGVTVLSAFDQAQILYTLVRTQYTFEVFAATGVEMQPLYADEPRNMTIVDGEAQYEDRWTFDLHVQFNPVVTMSQDFAAALALELVEVDSKFPPES